MRKAAATMRKNGMQMKDRAMGAMAGLALGDALGMATTLLFGVYASAAFLGIRMNRKNILALLTFSCITGVFYVLFFVLHGTSFTEQVYPFIIHIPLVLFLTFYYKYKMEIGRAHV